VGERADDRRRPATIVPESAASAVDGPGWLGLSDDDLLCAIQRLPAGHGSDAALLAVVTSGRHFFIRQEAAKRVADREALKRHSEDRHIGQILVRHLDRADDVGYLERLAAESRHIEVRNAAEAQLQSIGRKPRK
jgi:hypothetical protein